jgi:predicted phage terminase large subunit-like protein
LTAFASTLTGPRPGEGCKTLHGFVEEFWSILEPKRPFVSGWALKAMCAHLEAVSRGEILRLLITVPPGMMKSLILVFWTAWEWGPQGNAHRQCLATSFSQPNVLRDNLKLRRLIDSEKFQTLWPLRLRADQNAKGKFENVENGFSEARPFSAMTGGRGDRVKVDDPHSVDSAESDAERTSAVTTFREGITDRLNDVQTSAIVIIMQRLHQGDVAGTVIDPDLNMGFVHLNLPMEFEVERISAAGIVTGGACKTYVNGALFFTDPRTVEGELLFPERFPAAEVARLKRAKGAYAWAGQYQQRPAPRDGGIFQRSWFKIVHALPATCRRKARGWDLGATQGGGDFTAGVKGTKDDAPDGAFYFTNAVRQQLGGAGVEGLIVTTAAADGRDTVIRLPQDPGAAGKTYVNILASKLAGYAVQVVLPSGNKITRAMALATQAEAGNVYLLATGNPDQDAWIGPFLDEICVFPAGVHDDQVDAAADCFNELAFPPVMGTRQVHIGFMGRT